MTREREVCRRKTMLHLTFALATAVVAVVGHPTRVAAVCPSNPDETFFYPSGWSPSGSVSTYRWYVPPEGRSGLESFDAYKDGQLIEDEARQSLRSHLEVTSGTLFSRYVDVWPRAWTTSPAFRMLAVGLQGLNTGPRVKWTNGTIQARFYVKALQTPKPGDAFRGIHLYGRYRTDMNKYVAGLWTNGLVKIKKKICGDYVPIYEGPLRGPDGAVFKTNRWYTLKLSVIGSTLSFSVDGVLQRSISDPTFSWGTFGVRTDYVDTYVEDVQVY